MSDFMLGQNERTLGIVNAGSVWNKILCIKKDLGVPTIQLE